MNTLLHWFRRDLRLADNDALTAASADGKVIPVFVYDETILARADTGQQRLSFLSQSLDVLSRNLLARGSRLLILRGDPTEQLVHAARELGASAVYFNRDYEPYSRQRDAQVTEALEKRGIVVKTFSSHLLTEPDVLLTGAGRPYTVYTPYKRAALERLLSAPPIVPPAPSPERLVLDEETLATIEKLDAGPPPDLLKSIEPRHQPGGEDAGRARLAEFIESNAEYEQQRGTRIGLYSLGRNQPAHPGTARISAHLRMGTLGVRTCYQAALQFWQQSEPAANRQFTAHPVAENEGKKGHNLAAISHDGAQTWLGEMLWRDFYYQIMWHFPYIESGPFQRKFAALKWRSSVHELQAWQQGRTGYPMVDAGMRQLNREAWMHNRLRMIVASFLCKDLHINWQAGELYFMQQLEDGDLASNNGGWQWAAGTGTDAQPYFRIFNPTTQGQKFDPDGEYVRRYIPELASVSAKYIHAPWLMPRAEQERVGCIIGKDYPAPIVDHATARHEALAMYSEVASATQP